MFLHSSAPFSWQCAFNNTYICTHMSSLDCKLFNGKQQVRVYTHNRDTSSKWSVSSTCKLWVCSDALDYFCDLPQLLCTYKVLLKVVFTGVENVIRAPSQIPWTEFHQSCWTTLTLTVELADLCLSHRRAQWQFFNFSKILLRGKNYAH